MEQKREPNKTLGWLVTALSIGELIVALGIVAYGLLKGHMSGMTSNAIMGGALALYWVLADIVEPFVMYRFDGITQAQKEAYIKYIVLEFIGYVGIACFLFGVGLGSSGSNNGILGAVVYVVVMKPKRQNQQIFYGHIKPEEEEPEEEEPAEEGEEKEEAEKE